MHDRCAGGGGQWRGAGDDVETSGPYHRRSLQRPTQQPPAVHQPGKLGRVILHTHTRTYILLLDRSWAQKTSTACIMDD